MRFYEFETKKVRHPARPNLITLRHLNQQKRTIAQQVAAEEMRKPLLAAMYGRPTEDSVDHEIAMRAVKLEQEKAELAKKLEFAKGKKAIEIGDRKQLVPTLQKIADAVRAGELDDLIAGAAVFGKISK